MNGVSPLHVACQRGHDKCVSLLLQAGANMEHIHITGLTPLLEACLHGQLKCAALLVEHGANIHFRNPSMKSALMLSY